MRPDVKGPRGPLFSFMLQLFETIWCRTSLLLLLTAPTYAQSVDSVWIFRDAREWTEAHQKPLVIVSAVFSVALQGNLAAAHYATAQGNPYWADIHGASELLGISHTALMYSAGLDPVEALGASMIGQFFAQIAINAASGLPLINPRESREYEVAGISMSWKRWGVGYMRWAKLGVGVILVFYRPILRAIRRMF